MLALHLRDGPFADVLVLCLVPADFVDRKVGLVANCYSFNFAYYPG